MPLTVDRRRDAARTTRNALQAQLDRYLPDEAYRNYFRWALSARNPERALFCRIIALTQLGNLTAAMLSGLPGKDDWHTRLRCAVPVNLYQIFEVVSDNLGLGLATVPPGADSELRDLLLDFNAIAVADLCRPTDRPAADLLAELAPRCARLGGAERNLVPHFHAAVARRYAGEGIGPSSDATTAALWSGLAANLESGRDVLASIAGTRTEALVRARTVQRYSAVGRTLTAPDLTRADLVASGRDAILVVPTLGYFGAVFNEISLSDRGYRTALDSGLLERAFDTAALLVRLQNDIGTTLLRQSAGQRAEFVAKCRATYPSESHGTAIDLLVRAAAEPELNRFRKDLRHGEFNICLYEVHRCRFAGRGAGGVCRRTRLLCRPLSVAE
ncbi:hypothetical protein [Nocardia anaemiae]|uniref:hypothetical protein n=1 Tax=Nocardia anaemiae TaxID=263910 RepID=UPI0007A388E4|nr:hypothetical protein [Nocardia anaemiae]